MFKKHRAKTLEGVKPKLKTARLNLFQNCSHRTKNLSKYPSRLAVFDCIENFNFLQKFNLSASKKKSYLQPEVIVTVTNYLINTSFGPVAIVRKQRHTTKTSSVQQVATISRGLALLSGDKCFANGICFCATKIPAITKGSL